MRDPKQILAENKVVLADGAMGTQLSDRGLPAGEAPERWNLDRPDQVQAMAADYAAAGAQIVLTNTFGGSRPKLAKAGLGDAVEEVNRRGAELARTGAGEDACVLASVGPTGELAAPLGTMTEDQMVEAFAEQIAAALVGGADGVVVETMIALEEATAAVRAARQAGAPFVVACLTYDKGPRGLATMMGVTPAQAAPALLEAGADVIGSNCGMGIELMQEVAAALHDATEAPLWCKPNAGRPELVDGRTVFRQTPAQMAAGVPSLVEAGCRVVGGCCGTTPEHIRAFAETLAELR